MVPGPGPGMAGRFFHDAGGGWSLDRHEIEYENRGGRGLIVEGGWHLLVYSSIGMDWQGSSRGGTETTVVAAAICVERTGRYPGGLSGNVGAIYSSSLSEREACVCTYNNGSEADGK